MLFSIQENEKSLKKIRLKIPFDGENESMHSKLMYNNSAVKCMSTAQQTYKTMMSR
jgi:hypothetical protein